MDLEDIKDRIRGIEGRGLYPSHIKTLDEAIQYVKSELEDVRVEVDEYEKLLEELEQI